MVAEDDNKTEKIYTLEEYYELEEKSTYKSEFRNGKIIPVHLLPEVLNINERGNLLRHNRIKLRLTFLIYLHIEDKSEYEAFDSSQNIYFPKSKNSLYPDISVVSGEVEIFNNDDGLINPSLIIEIVSNATEHYDRGRKFHKYQTISSLQEYVLVDSKSPIIDIFTKIDDGWLMKTYIGLEEEIHFKSIDVTLKMADIYQKVDNLKDPQIVLDFDGEE